MSAARLEGAALLAHPLAAAFVAVVRERGYELAEVEEITARAGVKRGEFDRSFADKEEATTALLEAMIADFRLRVGSAYDLAPRWPDNLRLAAYETARWIGDNPDLAWFGMVAALDAGEMARVRREENFLWCAALIDRGRAAAPDPAAVPASAPLHAVGAVAEVLRRRLEGSLAADIVGAVPEMMYGAVRPYLGEQAARRELAIPAPADLAAWMG